MTDSQIENISDTARWVALYRALESERPDALFRDPYARELAGVRGEAIAKAMPAFRSGLWPMVVRTCVFDELILRAIKSDGVDTIVNLAAGLDARPWRMTLPPSTRWIDVDLPDILAYKSRVLTARRPGCAYAAESLDLRDGPARRAFFERIGRDSRRALILTEGLLIYLTPAEVGSLASDLHAPPTFRWWIIDIVAPRLLQMLRKRWAKSLEAGNATLQFAPPEGTEFFKPHGWKEVEFRSTWDESRRLRREMPMAWFWRFLSRFSPEEKRREFSRMGGNVLLERL